jgi:hypothetical protein
VLPLAPVTWRRPLLPLNDPTEPSPAEYDKDFFCDRQMLGVRRHNAIR